MDDFKEKVKGARGKARSAQEASSPKRVARDRIPIDPSTLPMKGRGTLRAEAERLACFPEERLEFRAWPEPGSRPEDIGWSGDGSPTEATGRTFRTSFDRAGKHTVRVVCGDASAEFVVTVCPIDDWMAEAAQFYGPSVDLTGVRGVEPPGPGTAGTAFTCNQVIRFKRLGSSRSPSSSTLVHELGHVWEHQDDGRNCCAGSSSRSGNGSGGAIRTTTAVPPAWRRRRT